MEGEHHGFGHYELGNFIFKVVSQFSTLVSSLLPALDAIFESKVLPLSIYTKYKNSLKFVIREISRKFKIRSLALTVIRL